MKKLIFILIVLLMFGCGKPVAVEIKDVCSQPAGTNVVIQGYISLPPQIETIQLTRKGRLEAVGLQLFLMTKADATGDEVRTIFWTSDKDEPNKIKPLPREFTWNDLLVYTDDGKQIGAGKIVKITGEVKPDEKSKCEVNVTKIENP
ncbi:MAG: hypothetical protein ABJA66_03540 [Actinomycetota bacterium]